MTKELAEVLDRLNKKDFTSEEIQLLNQIYSDTLLYNSALKKLQTQIEILRDDFRKNNAYNPIEHIKVRIKQPESLMKKMYLKGFPLTVDSIRENVNDIAGIRIVCTFKSDIYKLASLVENAQNIEILQIKDYVTNPKESGYKSYHLIVEVPVFLIKGELRCKVEVQLRTMAMDFWASLEHKIKYKYDFDIPEDIRAELRSCAKVVDKLDDKMLSLHTIVHNEEN